LTNLYPKNRSQRKRVFEKNKFTIQKYEFADTHFKHETCEFIEFRNDKMGATETKVSY